MRRLFWACVLGVSMLALMLPTFAHAGYPGANGRVAWEAFPGGSDSEIVSANSDGSTFTQLTTNTVDDKDPAWSPDGKKIAFARLNSGTGLFEIWTMNADGSAQAALVTQPRSVTHPTWSGDGTRIAFEYAFSASDDDIYTAATSGLNASVAGLVTSTLHERDPAWSPTTNQIAFSKFNTGTSHYDVVSVPFPPGAVTPIISDPAHDYTEPAWSPGGTQLAAQYQQSATNDDIRTFNTSGTGISDVSTSGLNERNPAWSPEGQLIAYDRDGDFDLVIHNATGSLAGLITSPGVDRNPDWQPVTTAQVRPQGATPLHLALVIAFDGCSIGNVQHDPPVNLPACAPPKASSKQLTVGEPLVNGKPAKANGFIKIRTLAPANGELTVSMQDVRCASFFTGCNTLLGDYTGNLALNMTFRLTDRANAGGVAGIVPHVHFNANVPCQATADTTVGATCSVLTNMNAVTPGLVVPGKRASWELATAQLSDPSSDAFAVPGVFFP